MQEQENLVEKLPIKDHLLVIRYSLEELRRIFVDENTLIDSNEPIKPRSQQRTSCIAVCSSYQR